MARGKYATRSEATSARDRIAEENRRLTHRVRALENDLAESRAAHRTEKALHDTTRVRLTADVEAGSSDRVRAVQAQLAEAREEIESWKGKLASVQRVHDKFYDGMMRHFVHGHKMTGSAAHGLLFEMLGENGITVPGNLLARPDRLSDAAVDSLLAARTKPGAKTELTYE
ncbi:hypothetical protein [Microbacterium sp. PRC9]|uniref:hypothetical protein n=1 Tax=Microbacterium sp. PRC9 TaxID=2962591 RepID=UPI002881D5EC|nr:hypothetical protein [Microbacterium sp. PRC9]MDT0143084.1 hypothetical protein [Microbacterium sp. PRC9]